jgi:adenine-specific DNA-methyltransferase
VARDLLSDSGSIFVQIGDENMHRVRGLMDEVFRDKNFVSQVVFEKTSSTSTEEMASISDHILWFAKNRTALKFRSAYR